MLEVVKPGQCIDEAYNELWEADPQKAKVTAYSRDPYGESLLQL